MHCVCKKHKENEKKDEDNELVELMWLFILMRASSATRERYVKGTKFLHLQSGMRLPISKQAYCSAPHRLVLVLGVYKGCYLLLSMCGM